MRLTIDHSDEQADFTGMSRNYYINCHVIFSEEEQAIIRERGLNHFAFETNNEYPAPTLAKAVIAEILRASGPLLILASFGIFFVSIFMGAPYIGLAWLTLWIGITAWLTGLYRTRAIARYELERSITVAHLLDSPRLVIWAKDPPWSKALEDKLRADLVQIKAQILASVDLGKRESVEL